MAKLFLFPSHLFPKNFFLFPNYSQTQIIANFPFSVRQHFMNFLLTKAKEKSLVFQYEKDGNLMIFSLYKFIISSSNLQWQVHQFSHLLNSNLSKNREDAYRTKSPETLINTRFSKKKSLAAEATRLVTHRGFEPRTP